MKRLKQTFSLYLSFVKFAHTIFAMPFALTGFAYALSLQPERFAWSLLFKVILAMVFARNAAMGFNRYLDRDIDALNERTRNREIPQGLISPQQALLFVFFNALLFVLTAYWINTLCFYLSPVALFVLMSYSYTKRFTSLSHFVLGLALALSPIGALLAVRGKMEWNIIWLSFGVLTWVAGFDIIYALQDEQVDRQLGLKSIPATVGTKNALLLSRLLHAFTAGSLFYFGYLIHASWLYYCGYFLFIASLLYQHHLVKPDDLSKVNIAFFTTNGFASLFFGFFAILHFLFS
jgi:4-hydroxybenzoate polyprenyltransferase